MGMRPVDAMEPPYFETFRGEYPFSYHVQTNLKMNTMLNLHATNKYG